MNVIIAGHAGFCYGVKRAVDIAMNVEKNNGIRAYTLGPLIHNPQMVELLKKEGLMPVDDLESCKGKKIMIRTHGTAPENVVKAKEYKCSIIDATCPYVKKAQKAAEKLYMEGYAVFIVGESDHPEIKGIVGFAKGNATVLKDENEVPLLEDIHRIGLVAQTTISENIFAKVARKIVPEVKELRVFNTICSATKKRQISAVNLSINVDVMIVAGGKNSANTTRLTELCSQACKKAYHVETSEEIDSEWFLKDDTVGVTAGASTPDWIVKEVVDKLMKI
jgi:(E)-4-hydroxy-3-methyl-but-2-enyl pyrophosphate reductase